MNYTIIEKETYAIYKTILRFITILFCGKIVIKTDNRNSLFMAKNPTSRINRWKQEISQYSITLLHLSGSKNKAADFMSRINYKTINDNANLNYDINILKKHIELGHPGAFKTYKTLKNKFNMEIKFKDVVKEIKQCIACRCNVEDKIKYIKIKGFASSEYPLEKISSDIIGPFPNNIFQQSPYYEKFFLLTITDIFTRFTEIYLMKSITSKNILDNGFKKFFKDYEKPKVLISDNGRQYTSLEFSEFIKNNNMKHIKISSYNPTANGISERLNQTILKIFRIYKGNCIQKIIPIIKKNLNENYNTAIKNFPSDIFNKYIKNETINLKQIKSIDNFKRNLSNKKNK
ncbi:Pro-Pol polyprotein [Dictyocoela muelleri]|nr:Pro-Pol polyprotein [Dictyocoela muelleri]